MKFTETFTSATATHVHFDLYLPNVILRYKAIVQIHHGTGEHSGWYQKFAEYLANDGYVVVVPDFPGHGSSLHNFEQGFFGEGHPVQTLVADIQRLRQVISSRYPELPYFVLGNQFGSLVLREYLAKYGDFVQGAIIMGTCGKPPHLKLGQALIRLQISLKGQMHRSKFVKRAIDNHWSKNIKNGNYKTQDSREYQQFLDDPMTDFIYTNIAYSEMISIAKSVSQLDKISKIPSYLSILIVSGRHDIFGQMGKGPKWLYQQLKKNNVTDLSLILYDEKRQDILHEVNRKDVYKDILDWLNDRTYI